MVESHVLVSAKMRTSYKARQQRQYHERNDKANLQLFVCAHDIGQAGL